MIDLLTQAPVIQAPMVGSLSPLVIAVCAAGGLGSLACAALSPDQIRREVAAIRAETAGPFNLNFFCHTPPTADAAKDAAWLEAFAPYYAEADVPLTAARRGVYSEYALRTTPQDIINRYFTKEDATFRIASRAKQLVSFGQINLNDKFAVKRVERSNIVFCRNVIIYFDDEMKKQVIGSFYDNLLQGGYLLIGHSESLHNITRAFKPEHHTGAIIYRKLE